jgi:predicted nucleotidyltransferase
MVNKSAAINLAKQFIEHCKNNGLSIRAAWLFGSYARGNQREESDIDLALISDSFTVNFIENIKKTAIINFNFPDIEVHHFNTQVFNSDTPFIEEIKETGIKIYG